MASADTHSSRRPPLNAQEQITRFHEFFEKFYYARLLEHVRKGETFLVVDFRKLSAFDPELAEMLLNDPEETLAAAELAIKEFDLPKHLDHFYVRVKNYPPSIKIMIRDVRTPHLGKMVWTEGTVRQKSDVRPQVVSTRFECPSCGTVITVLQIERKFREPSACSCGRKGKFKELSKELIDAQGIVLEEATDDLEGGEQPKRINVLLKNDLVSPLNEKRTSPGSKIRIAGWISEIPTTLKDGGKSTKFDLVFEANHTEAVEEDYTDIKISNVEEEQIKELAQDPHVYEKLVDNIAPSIYGHEKTKEGLLLQFVGGVRKEHPDGTVTRGDMHVLLVGDPGCGKSQLLKRSIKVAPKARYVSGKGVSGAGLTAAVIKDEFLGGWSLEAGALVLSNHGFVMIDELDKMGKEDRAAMHEALEQQSYHYDTEIMFADGTTEKIGVFVDQHMINGTIIQGKDCEIATGNFPQILTTDFMSIYPIKIDRISRHKTPSHFYKISYSNGRSIVVTPEHPVFVVENDMITTKEASAVEVGMYAPIPRAIPTNEVMCEEDEQLGTCLGLICSEGYTYKNSMHRYAEIGICNTSAEVNERASSALEAVFHKRPSIHIREIGGKAKKELTTTRITSQGAFQDLKQKAPELFTKARNKRIPQIVKKGSITIKKSFIEAFFLGDGFVDQERMGFVTSSDALAKDLQQLLSNFCIYSYIETEQRDQSAYCKVIVSGERSYQNMLVFVRDFDKRKKRIVKLYQRSRNKRNDREILPNSYVPSLIQVLDAFRLNNGYFYKHMKGNKNVHWETARAHLNRAQKHMQHAFYVLERGTIKEVRTAWKIPLKKIAAKLGISVSLIYYQEKRGDTHLANVVRKLADEKKDVIMPIVKRLHQILQSEIRFVKIKSVEKNENNDQEWTYDVTVEPNHTFISQNLVLHNTVSISKANIQATLRAETTVLAAANPKFGRFNQMEPLAPQIDLPPTLINRFDLIFPIKDMPDKARDEKMAQHILGLHQDPALSTPKIPTDLLRKFIAYARKTKPKISNDALDEIKTYYVSMRNKGETQDSGLRAIPITARQLEALVRLAEASAKIRLSELVAREDAKRAIALLEYCLMQVARDMETGQIDIDQISTGISTTQRSKIIVLKELIGELENQIGKTIPIEDVVDAARHQGISREQVEDVIEKLKRQGDIFEPKRGFIQRIT